MHGINAEFATAVRGICADFQNRCAEFRKFPRGFRLALVRGITSDIFFNLRAKSRILKHSGTINKWF
jgi:hypothetical protein